MHALPDHLGHGIWNQALVRNICIYEWMYVCIHTHTHSHIHMHYQIITAMGSDVRLLVASICMYVCTHTHMHALPDDHGHGIWCPAVRMQHMYVCIYVCTHTHTCMHYQIISAMGSETRLLVASIRDVESMANLAAAGCNTFTFSPEVASQLSRMYVCMYVCMHFMWIKENLQKIVSVRKTRIACVCVHTYIHI
jgi:hypothetical protein